jgi:hypothetical protein
MKINEYRKQRFALGSAPDLRTLKRLVDEGELAGKRLGKTYYVEVDKHLNEFSVFEKEVMNHG